MIGREKVGGKEQFIRIMITMIMIILVITSFLLLYNFNLIFLLAFLFYNRIIQSFSYFYISFIKTKLYCIHCKSSFSLKFIFCVQAVLIRSYNMYHSSCTINIIGGRLFSNYVTAKFAVISELCN